MSNAETFASDVSKILEEYGKEARLVLEETVPEAATTCVKMIRSNSRKRTGRYAKGWAKKKQYSRMGDSYVVYNKDRYRVAHLLENPHTIRNQSGSYGRTEGDGVIREAADYAENWLYDETVKRLEGK